MWRSTRALLTLKEQWVVLPPIVLYSPIVFPLFYCTRCVFAPESILGQNPRRVKERYRCVFIEKVRCTRQSQSSPHGEVAEDNECDLFREFRDLHDPSHYWMSFGITAFHHVSVRKLLKISPSSSWIHIIRESKFELNPWDPGSNWLDSKQCFVAGISQSSSHGEVAEDNQCDLYREFRDLHDPSHYWMCVCVTAFQWHFNERQKTGRSHRDRNLNFYMAIHT